MLIVFDLDGTVIDSARDLGESASELVQTYGASGLRVSDVTAMVGDGAAALVKRALTHAALDPDTPGALERFLAIYDRRLMDHTIAYGGMHEVLAFTVERGPMAVLTNKPLLPSLRILEAVGLRGFFSHVIGGDGPHARKPDPAGMLALMAAAPGEPAILVGDSPADARTASAAGCAFCLARYGFGAGRFGGVWPDTPYAIDHPRDLLGVLARFAAAATP